MVRGRTLRSDHEGHMAGARRAGTSRACVRRAGASMRGARTEAKERKRGTHDGSEESRSAEGQCKHAGQHAATLGASVVRFFLDARRGGASTKAHERLRCDYLSYRSDYHSGGAS